MEQINDCFNLYEHQQQHQHMSNIQHNDLHIPTVAFQSLDTVRALHRTVVSLRKALEKAHREIDSLKKQITVKDDIEEGKKYRGQEFSASNKRLDNLLLNLSESNDTQNDNNEQIKSQVRTQNVQGSLNNDVPKGNDEHSELHQSTESLTSNQSPSLLISKQSCASSRKATTAKFTHSTEHNIQHSIKAQESHRNQSSIAHLRTFKETQTNKSSHTADTSVTLPDRRLPQMASKIDVKIKLTSNFHIDGNDTSSETADSVSGKM